MNPTNHERGLPELGALNYALLCGLALAVIFLVQLQQGLVLTNALAALVGALGLVSRLRLAPVLLLLAVAGAQLLQRRALGGFGWPRWTGAAQGGNDLVLAAGMLAYVAGHFRLQGFWHEIMPRDPRQRVGPARPSFFTGEMIKPIAAQQRAVRHLSPAELVWFLVSLALWVLVGQLAWFCLTPPRQTLHMAPWFWQLLVLTSSLLVGSFVSRQLLLQWTFRQMTPVQARLTLQDILWKETRREQRRLQRWIKWREVTGTKPKP